MYTHVLVPLDGSPLAEQALPHAEAIAAKFGAALTLFAATTAAAEFGPPVLIGGQPVGPLTPTDFDRLAAAGREEAVTYLRAVAERLRARGLTLQEHVADGPAPAAIVTQAQVLGIDLIVMATHGRGGLGRLLLGSVADEVLRHARCPVLLVRAGEAGAIGQEEPTNGYA